MFNGSVCGFITTSKNMTKTEHFVRLECALKNAASIFFSFIFPHVPAAFLMCAAAAAAQSHETRGGGRYRAGGYSADVLQALPGPGGLAG